MNPHFRAYAGGPVLGGTQLDGEELEWGFCA
jgi:hypothetical protein